MSTLVTCSLSHVTAVVTADGYRQLEQQAARHLELLQADTSAGLLETDAIAQKEFPSPPMATFTQMASRVESNQGHHVGTVELLDYLAAVLSHSLTEGEFSVPNAQPGRWSIPHVTTSDIIAIFGSEAPALILRRQLAQLSVETH